MPLLSSVQMGTVPALSPVRAAGSRTRGLLGELGRAITPVRRSARKMAQAPPRPLEAMLEEADFSYGAFPPSYNKGWKMERHLAFAGARAHALQ